MRIMNYKILSRPSIEELEELVNENLKRWFIPQWGPFLNDINYGKRYNQAMIKLDEKKK
jgi:hypothetical protein